MTRDHAAGAGREVAVLLHLLLVRLRISQAELRDDPADALDGGLVLLRDLRRRKPPLSLGREQRREVTARQLLRQLDLIHLDLFLGSGLRDRIEKQQQAARSLLRSEARLPQLGE